MLTIVSHLCQQPLICVQAPWEEQREAQLRDEGSINEEDDRIYLC